MQTDTPAMGPAPGPGSDASEEGCTLHQIFDRTITALSVADAEGLAEVLHQCSRVALPGPGREWGLAVEKHRILAALLRETGRNLRLLNGPPPGEGYTR